MSEDGILVRKTTIYTNYAINCLIIEHTFTFLTVRVSYLFWSTQNTTDDSIDGDDVDALLIMLMVVVWTKATPTMMMVKFLV